MEPTDHNRRAFDEAHRTSENVLQVPGMPERIKERLQGATGHRVLHLLSGTGRESVDLADLGALRRLRAAEPFAGGVSAALRPGGVFLLHDDHPAAACLDAFGRWRGNYFESPPLGGLV